MSLRRTTALPEWFFAGNPDEAVPPAAPGAACPTGYPVGFASDCFGTIPTGHTVGCTSSRFGSVPSGFVDPIAQQSGASLALRAQTVPHPGRTVPQRAGVRGQYLAFGRSDGRLAA